MKKILSLLLSLSGAVLSANPARTLLPIGSVAPDFTLLTQAGDTVRLSEYRGKESVVLVFYPGDATPGCTKQLCAIRDDYAGFAKLSARVFGVNPGSAKSHADFVSAHRFPFPLLVDQDKKVAKLYGCDALLMVQRTVYAVAPDGRIVFAKRGAPPVAEILKALPPIPVKKNPDPEN